MVLFESVQRVKKKKGSGAFANRPESDNENGAFINVIKSGFYSKRSFYQAQSRK
jgi:hypothetical protein